MGSPNLCDYYLNGEPQSDAHRLAFVNYLRLFARLRELIREQVVIFLPEFPSLFPARNAVKTLSRPNEWERLRSELGSEFEEGPCDSLRKVTEESLWVGKKFGLDLFLPGRGPVTFFEAYSRLCGGALPESRILEAASGSLLLECELPAIDNVSFDDMIRIREAAEGFAAWRSSLRRVLERSYGDLSRGTFDARELRRLAFEEFAAARAAAEQEVSKSSVMALAKEGTRSVGVGLLTALITAATAPGAEIIAASATAGVTFLWDYVGWHIKGSERRRNVAIKAHYAVWDEPRRGAA